MTLATVGCRRRGRGKRQVERPERGLDHGYTFALVNLAWAPGQALGAAGGGALAHATRDAVPYLALSAVCGVTLAALWRLRTDG